MILKVNHDGLNNVSNTMKKDKDIFNAEIEKILANIKQLRTIWIGEDSNVFCNNFAEFANKMKRISKTLDVLSNVCYKTNNGYKEIDEEVSEELKREAMINE